MAQQEANKLRTILDDGYLPASKQTSKANRGKTFNEIAGLCKQDWLRRQQEGDLSSTTVAGYNTFLKPLEKQWGKKLIAAITFDEVLDYRAALAERKSQILSNRRLFILKQLFAKAKILGAIREDEIAGIKYLSEKGHERKSFMYPAKVDKLLEKAASSRAKHYLPLAILLAVEHGASKQEILDLKWADITLDYGETGVVRFYRTKTGVERVHQLMPRTREALLKRKAHLAKGRETRNIKSCGDYVVGHMDGSRMGDFKTAWKRVCGDLDLHDFHFHDNRHTFCSNIIMAGGTLKHAKEMIGHKTLRMTDRYSHLEAARENIIQSALASHYAGPSEAADT
ncbi:site-specific integrase [Pseudodesulfovibrio sp.]|nr:site-specific integrase [Pseudodesulfovibrio sp.]